MDGYIKNKKEAIKSARRGILWSYAITFIILIFIPLWIFIITTNQPPEKWTQAEIVFSHITEESVGFTNVTSYVLNTQDGKKFVIQSRYVDVQDLSANLIPGNRYRIVFSNTIAGGDHMEALSDNSVILQDLDRSIVRWQKEQHEMVIAIIVTLVIEALALVLIDRLACNKLYAEIAKLKADIKRREAKIRKK